MTAFILTSVSGAAITAVGGPAIATGTVGASAPSYRLLEDHWPTIQEYLPATSIVSENDYLPLNWVPTPNVDPLNTAAVQNFYAQGPRILGLVRVQFSTQAFPSPPIVTYWKQISPTLYALTGLGSNQTIYPPLPGE